MSFSTLIFPLIFLPVSFLLYLLTPKPAKNVVLLILSLVFFAWGSPVYLVLLLLSIVFNYFTAQRIAQSAAAGQTKWTRFALISGVAVNLLILGFFKYFGFLLENCNAIFGTKLTPPPLPIFQPMGLSGSIDPEWR